MRRLQVSVLHWLPHAAKARPLPGCAKPATSGSGGGGGSVDFAAGNDFDKEDRLIRASDGYSYFIADLEGDGDGEVPFRIIPERGPPGFQGNNPRTKKIMGSIQQNYNPESYGEENLSDHYKKLLDEFRCHGGNNKEGAHCEKCGLEILKPDWTGNNVFGDDVSDEESS